VKSRLVLLLIVAVTGCSDSPEADLAPQQPQLSMKPLPPTADGADADRRTLEQLREAGADLSRPTLFKHFLVFRAEGSADASHRWLKHRGYLGHVARPQRPQEPWAVIVQNQGIPSPPSIARMRAVMEATANRYGGEYDGWEAEVQN
jgi:hypothetical protein